MPKYNLPSLDHICECIQQLEGRKENTTRKNQISLLKTVLDDYLTGELPKENMQGILVGALIFALKTIQKEYDQYYLSYLWSSKHSQMFCKIEKALTINDKNILDDSSAFIFLVHFLQYAKKNQQNLPTNTLEKAVTIATQTKNNLHIEISQLFARLSTVNYLGQHFHSIIKQYEDKCANDSITYYLLHLGGRSATRKKAVKLIQVLEERCNQFSSPHEEKNDDISNYFLRFGAALSIMREIEIEYKLRSPENSDLYRIMQQITGVNRTSQLSLDFKEASFARLYDTLCNDVISEEKMRLWNTHGTQKAELDRIKREIVALCTELNKSKEEVILSENETFNNLINRFFHSISFAITQSGVVFGLLETANLMMQSSISFETMLAIAATPQNALLIMASVWAINQFKANMNSLAAEMVVPYVDPFIKTFIMPFSKKPGLFSLDANSSIHPEDRALATALYHSPDEICSLAEKRKLESIFDFLRSPAEQKEMAEQSLRHIG